MMSGDGKPQVRSGLLASDHSKRGRRFVTILQPKTQEVTLLEPWEHAILVLCDGTRTLEGLLELLPPEIDGQALDREVVRRCLKFFERQRLIVSLGLRTSDAAPPGPVTVSELQAAYAEWHRTVGEPSSPTALAPPLPRSGVHVSAGLEPTVAPGRAPALLTGVQSLLGGEEPIPDLLAALDDAVAEANEVVERERAGKARRAVDERAIVESESRPPTSGLHERKSGVLVSEELGAPGRPISDAHTAPDAPPPRLAELLATDSTEPIERPARGRGRPAGKEPTTVAGPLLPGNKRHS